MIVLPTFIKNEDKGSCIVRIDKEDYEHLANDFLYDIIDEDPSEETEAIVENYVDKVLESGHIRLETAEFVKSKLTNTKPGPYYAQPKTHKFDEANHNMVSCERDNFL